MNENLTTSAKILAAQYASNSDVMFYHEALPGWLAALLIVAVLALVAIVVIVLDAISEEPTENFKEFGKKTHPSSVGRLNCP
jgi:cyanate permease